MSQVCHSQAWDSKMVTSAWWVYPHQVSKTAPTGEYLTVGSFMIRGKKNFLPPHPLVMGFGLLFRLDESSLGLHLNERRVRGEEEGGENELDEIERQKGESDVDENPEESEIGLNPPIPEVGSSLPSTEEPAVISTEDSKASNDGDAKTEPPNIVREAVASVTPQLEDLLDRALGIGSATTSSKKYNLDVSQADAVEEEHDKEEKKASMREKPYVSKAERRKLKKGQRDDTETNNAKQEYEKREENEPKPVAKKTPVVASSALSGKKIVDEKPGGGKASRGQKSKLKKIKDKYGDQDEEERRIRMALLAVSSMTENQIVHH